MTVLMLVKVCLILVTGIGVCMLAGLLVLIGPRSLGWCWQAIVNAWTDRREARARARFIHDMHHRMIAYHRDERYRTRPARLKPGDLL